MKMDKTRLKIRLSELKGFENPKPELEQYVTPGDVAADVLWNAFMQKDIEGKIILDPCCGTGVLGIGALLLGAKFVYFNDYDVDAIKVLKENLSLFPELKGNYSIMKEEIPGPKMEKIDTIIQNPPFGTKIKHADKMFLEFGFDLAPVIYSLHKVESREFIDKISKDNGYQVTHMWLYDFELPMTMKFHSKKLERIRVACFRLSKK
ncbi:methyltransferase [Candidatus Woesearchaeota archaeon]|nr:methyltransferase [Candidatus Woesearchaeota archaeon]